MTIYFKPEVGAVLHGRERLLPGVPLAFEDPDAEPYFIAMGWAEDTEHDPVYTYDQATISVDPMTRNGSTGQLVLPEAAAAAVAANGGETPAVPSHYLGFPEVHAPHPDTVIPEPHPEVEA